MGTEDLFKFVSVRPVQAVDPDHVDVAFTEYGKEPSPLHKEVLGLDGPRTRLAATELAQRFMDSDRYVAAPLDELTKAVHAAANATSVHEAKAGLEAALGSPVPAYLRDRATRALRDRLWDSLYAQVLAPEVRPADRNYLYDAIRAIHFVAVLARASDDARPMAANELGLVTILIPRNLVPAVPKTSPHEDLEPLKGSLTGRLEDLIRKSRLLRETMTDVRNGHRTFLANEARRFPVTIVVDTREPVTTRPLPIRELAEPTLQVAVQAVAPPAWVAPMPVGTLEIAGTTVPRKQSWLFGDFGKRNLSETTKAVLGERRAHLAERAAPEIVTSLRQELTGDVTAFLASVPGELVPHFATLDAVRELFDIVPLANPPFLPVAPSPAPPAVAALAPTPADRGIQPLGIGDLLVVREELLRYLAGEVAHIENVLKSETKTRTHTRLQETEETEIVETERIEETERDQQTTERFELHKETQRTIETDLKFEAGFSLTASYGVVSTTANADFALSQSSSESQKTATDFAKQVTDRSLSKIQQRAREQRTRRTLERIEEKNEHGFVNVPGTGHVIGVYRWVDKHYKARIVNYGRRLMIEFIIPEPAAFYLHLEATRKLPGVTLEKPKPPMVGMRPLRPDDLYDGNYMTYVARYHVKDVEPYPPDVVKVAAGFAETAGGEEGKNAPYAKVSEKLTVPAGYVASDVYGQMSSMGVKNSGHFSRCFIGGDEFGSVTAEGIGNIIPISVNGWGHGFNVNVVAECELTDAGLAKWQLKTYEAIMTAYERALSEYNEQVAAAEIQAGVRIEGRSGEANRKIERDELRKAALRMLTDEYAATRVSGTWRFNEMFNAMQSTGSFGYPEYDVDEALVEGKIIQFFEQAFEWQNLTYRFYPYFWGRKSAWKDIFPLDSSDPKFTDFLRAGAARVVIPAHPAYAEAVLHYLATNEIWNGGDPPTLNDPLYISIVDELKADTDRDLDEVPQCSPDSGYPCIVTDWDYKVPTTLVYLQPGPELPDFTAGP
jgi:hypothetical protein